MLRVEYPLGQKLPGHLKAKTGVPYESISLEEVRKGRVKSDDLSIAPDTLRLQAKVAEDAGYPQLSSNLKRAAELVRIPNKRLLEIYEALRPRHSTQAELLAIGNELLKVYHAPENAKFVREAAGAYKGAGLFRAPKVSRPVSRKRRS